MKISRREFSLVIGAAVAGILTGCSAGANNDKSTNKTTGPSVATNAEKKNSSKHDCKGKNECKGQGGCQSGDNGCKGQNSCKGHGGCGSNNEPKNEQTETKKSTKTPESKTQESKEKNSCGGANGCGSK